MAKRKKAQVAIEFIVVLGMLFLIFLTIIGFTFNEIIDINKKQKTVEAYNECLRLSEKAVSLFISGNGTSIEIDNEVNASFSPTNGLIIVNEKAICTIPINQIQEGTISQGRVKIQNQGDFIIFQNV